MKITNYAMKRNLSWDAQIDEYAENLAKEHSLKGGVSELVRLLVLDCGKNPEKYSDVLGASKKSFRAMVKELIDELQKEDRKTPAKK